MTPETDAFDISWLAAPLWIAFAAVDFIVPQAAGSLGDQFIAKLPALLGVGLGYLHWYTIQRDRKQKIQLDHDYKMAQLRIRHPEAE